uniref:Uncharacterized protein n=1 Tax=Glossina austeni TaxID=7395 RepID=A0A1A9VT32_GLOAU
MLLSALISLRMFTKLRKYVDTHLYFMLSAWIYLHELLLTFNSFYTLTLTRTDVESKRDLQMTACMNNMKSYTRETKRIFMELWTIVERENVSSYSAIVEPRKSHDRLTLQITEENQTLYLNWYQIAKSSYYANTAYGLENL